MPLKPKFHLKTFCQKGPFFCKTLGDLDEFRPDSVPWVLRRFVWFLLFAFSGQPSFKSSLSKRKKVVISLILI